jgi:hypothetical protein
MRRIQVLYTVAGAIGVAISSIGCAPADSEGGAGFLAEGYAGEPSTRLAFTPSAVPDEAPVWLQIDESDWELRVGDDWATAEALAVYDLSLEEGLWVDDVQMLPYRLVTGVVDDALEIVSLGGWETWYGYFPDTVEVSVDASPFTGRWVFAEGLGPIAIAIDGESRELVYYE